MTETSTSSQPERPSRRWFVFTSILTAFLLFFAFVSILYWHWLETPEPSSVVVIESGNPALDGMMIRVQGNNLQSPIEVKLDESNKYGARIYLNPGDYTIQIINPDGSVNGISSFVMIANNERRLNLQPPPANQ
ncbi:MAG: hypothetical protein IT448_06980 [Phycisphaerales bacterium]|nr:hypothetical protein [Phycisphaerales bacterium]